MIIDGPATLLSLHHLHSPSKNGTARPPLPTTEGPSRAKRCEEQGWAHRGRRPGLSGRTTPCRINPRSRDQPLNFAAIQSFALSGPGIERYEITFSPGIHLTISFSRNIGRHTMTDRIRSVFRTGQGRASKPSKQTVYTSTIDKSKPDLKSTAYATTKLAINMVKESSDAFPPLKSVAGGLSAILNHCDV